MWVSCTGAYVARKHTICDQNAIIIFHEFVKDKEMDRFLLVPSHIRTTQTISPINCIRLALYRCIDIASMRVIVYYSTDAISARGVYPMSLLPASCSEFAARLKVERLGARLCVCARK